MADISSLAGLRVLVVGLGREGAALAAYLASHQLKVTATDLRTAVQLGSIVEPLQNAGVWLVLGEHPQSLLEEADILFVSPGVPLETSFLQAAASRKIPLSTESRLFCHLCPAPVLGITGSSGKTTTTALLGKILEVEGRRCWVGGNIGRPLIGVVDQIAQDDIVVMELSSFQLEYFHGRLNKDVGMAASPAVNQRQLSTLLGSWSPPISALLNITPNHLDRHPSMKHYVRAKRAIIDYQGEEGVMVMSLDNDMTRTIGNRFGSRVRWFSLEAQVASGAGIVKNTLTLFDDQGKPQHLVKRDRIKLRGDHNLSNILAASLMAKEVGASIDAIRQVITTFSGVEHRLELVKVVNQVSYYNDSIATSPERLLAALKSFEEPVVLLAGGRDKHLPWADAARLMLQKSHKIILFGEAMELISAELEAVRPNTISDRKAGIHRTVNLEEAVQTAAQIANPGDIVLLSPGCASFDAFHDFAERGTKFKALVQVL